MLGNKIIFKQNLFIIAFLQFGKNWPESQFDKFLTQILFNHTSYRF